VKPEKFNSGLDHLSHILSGEDAGNLDDSLPDTDLFLVQMVDDYFPYIVQFLSTGVTPHEFTIAYKKQLVLKVAYYRLIERNLYKLGANGIMRRCVLDHEGNMILHEAHEGFSRGNYAEK
jgi:hypothetical protein